MLAHLARVLDTHPDRAPQEIADAVVELCGVDSAAIGVVAPGDGRAEAYRWEVTAGAMAANTGDATPYERSPSAIAVEQDCAVVLAYPEREFPEFASIAPPVIEALLVPFYMEGKSAGTLWAISHTPGHHLDAEDLRVLETLSHLASTAIRVQSNRSDEARARLAAIVESSDDAIVSKDVEGTIKSWNRGAERLFGYTAAEAVGQNITLIIPWDRLDEEPAILQRIRSGERVDHFETVRQHKGGTLLEISLTVSPVVDRQGRVVGASKIARDITERKHAEKALVESEERLRELNRSLEDRVDERTAELQRQAERLRELAAELTTAEQRERRRLAAMLHDDLQQSLVAVRMQLDWGREHAGEAAEADLTRAEQLLEHTMAASRNLTRQLRPPVLYEGGLVEALKGLASDIEDLYRLRVVIDADDHTPALNDDFKALLFESTRELLINAAKHAGVDRARVEIRRERSQLRISICDEGRGFDFDPAESESGRAKGFGLFSIRERLVALGGTTRIESTLGRGTRVDLEAPLAPEPADTPPPPNPARHQDSTDRQRTRVLVVDDHVVVRQGLVHVLYQHKPLTVVGEAGSGTEALEMIQRAEPDVVLMDVNLPGMNGIEATREIRRRWPRAVTVGLSVQDDSPTAESMREAGAAAFISKGADSSRLIATILGALDATSEHAHDGHDQPSRSPCAAHREGGHRYDSSDSA